MVGIKINLHCLCAGMAVASSKSLQTYIFILELINFLNKLDLKFFLYVYCLYPGLASIVRLKINFSFSCRKNI